MPAGTPWAVVGLILVRTPLGIIAVDFATGKRLWLRPLDDQLAGPPAADQGAGGADDGGGRADAFSALEWEAGDSPRAAGSGGGGARGGDWANRGG
jgi:hypothetical protein